MNRPDLRILEVLYYLKIPLRLKVIAESLPFPPGKNKIWKNAYTKTVLERLQKKGLVRSQGYYRKRRWSITPRGINYLRLLRLLEIMEEIESDE